MRKKIRKYNLILILILALAAFLRLWQLGLVPPSPDWDEAALGYNAYSLLKTGKDEYGQRLPLIFRSFDDYKPAIYAYLIIPFIKLFGLDLWVVRLPAALLGILAVFLVFLVTRELFPKHRFLPLMASFLLAISPWHLHFSRIAFETNVGMMVNLLWFFFFLKSLKKPWLLILAAFFAGLNIYVYQAEKVFTPLLVLAVVLIYQQKLFSLKKKWLVYSVLVGLVIILPFGYLALTTPEIFLRAKSTSFASDVTSFLSRTVTKLERDNQTGNLLGLLLDNRRITYGLAFLSGYLAHFDLNWLFLFGDEARHHAPGVGLLYLAELPFLLWGIYGLVFGRFSKRTKWLILAWLLLAPIPAAFSSGTPHAVRTIRMMPMIQIMTAIGFWQFWEWFKNRGLFLKMTLGFLGLSFFLFNFANYFNQYFVQLNYFTSQEWQYGYKQALEVIVPIEDQYEKIVVSKDPPLDQSYMFFLFYLRYDPVAYLAKGGTVSGGFAEEKNSCGKYEFRSLDWPNEEKRKEILYVGRPSDFHGHYVSVVKTINYLNGEPAIVIAEGK